MHPSGRKVYVSNGRGPTAMAIDVERNEVTARIPVGKRPWNMAIASDGSKLYVTNGRSDSVSVIDTATDEALAEISVGKLPWGVAIR